MKKAKLGSKSQLDTYMPQEYQYHLVAGITTARDNHKAGSRLPHC